MSDDAATRALAKRFFDAIEQGDVATVTDCYDPKVEIWHNFDEIVQTREENLETLKGMIGRLSDRLYDERQVETFPGGFVQQHVLRATRKDGLRVHLPAALVVRIRDGKIVRLDEYLDTAQVAAFRAAV